MGDQEDKGKSEKSLKNNNYTFEDLPRNLVLNIFSFLDLDDLGSFFFVNKKLNEYAKDDILWESIYNTTNWTVSLSENDQIIFDKLLQNEDFNIQELLREEEDDIITQENYVLLDKYRKYPWYAFFTLRFSVELVEEEEVYEEDVEYIQESDIVEYSGSDDDEDDINSVHQTPEFEKHINEIVEKNFEDFKLCDLICEKFSEFSLHFSRMDNFLITFISHHKIILDLIDLLFKKDEKVSQFPKVENLIIQVLSNELVCTKYFEQGNSALSHIFSFTEPNPDIERSERFYPCFAVLIDNIFRLYPNEIINFMAGNTKLVPYFIQSINENSKFSDLLIKLAENPCSHSWLLSSQFFPCLLSFLQSLEFPEEEEEAIELILEILRCCAIIPDSELVLDLFHNTTITDKITEYIFSSSTPPKSLPLSREDRIINGIKLYLAISSLITEAIVDMPFIIQQILLPQNLEFFISILKNSDSKYFGHVRLAVIELFSGLLVTGYSTVFDVFKSEKIFDMLLNLFFEFPWNNILHHHLLQIFCCLTFAGNDGQFITSVLESCNLINKIIEAFEKETPTTVGYLSYLQRISNELVDQAQHSAPICTLLESNEKWMEFMNTLENLNQLEVAQSQENEDYYEENGDEDYEGYQEIEEIEEVEEYQVVEEDQ